MNVVDYLLGCIALSLALLPWIPASMRLTRRLLPDESGASAVLAASIIAVSGLIVVAELVGVCDGLRRWPFAIVSAGAAGCVAAFGRGSQSVDRRGFQIPLGRAERVTLACVAICVITTSASLLGRDVAAAGTGPIDFDSVNYHLTQAAHMVRAHNLYHLHHIQSSDGTAVYPFNIELLDAIGMLGPHPDLAIFGLNLLFGWLALLACWVIGTKWSRGAPALAAGAAAMALPIVALGSSGPGLNDIPAMAFVLAAVALLSVAGVPRGSGPRKVWLTQVAMAGAALGLAAGTKLNALALVGLIAIGTVLLAKHDRRATLAALVAPALLTGGFWYLRDWIVVGSPLPDLNLTIAGHGLHLVPYPEYQPLEYTVAHYLGNYSVIRHWFVPGLHKVWSPLWPVVAFAAVVGVIVTLADRSRQRRMFGVAVVGGFVAYLVTPSTAQGIEGVPFVFATNTRYALPLIILALVLLATSPRLRRFEPVITVGFTALMVILMGLPRYASPNRIKFWDGLAVMIVLILAVLVADQAFRRWTSRAAVLLAAPAVLITVGVGVVVQDHYLARRYAGGTSDDRLYTALSGLHGTRIGLIGYRSGYPLFGQDLSNKVNYVGVTTSRHAFVEPTSCAAMVSVLADQHDGYVVVDTVEPFLNTAQVASWVSKIPGAVVVFSADNKIVYRMPHALPTDSCAAAGSR